MATFALPIRVLNRPPLFAALLALLGAMSAGPVLASAPPEPVPGGFNAYWPSNGYSLPFQLLVPQGTQPGRSYPLVVVLHGEAQRGTDNRLQLETPEAEVWGIAVTNQAVDPLYVLFPQCPTNASWLDLAVLADLTNVIAQVMAQRPIDPEQMHLDGYSIGARGALRLIAASAEWWDAAIIVAGALGPNEISDYSRLATVPLWFFASEDDPLVPFDAAYATFRRIWQAKGNPGEPTRAGDTSDPNLKLTVFPASMHLGHGIADLATAAPDYADFFVPVFPTQVDPVIAVRPAQPGVLAGVEVRGKIGEQYALEVSTDLSVWRAVATNTLPATRTWTFTLPANGAFPSHFYRARYLHPCYRPSDLGPAFHFPNVNSATNRQVLETFHQHLSRDVILHLPSGYDGTTLYPLILVLHPGNGSAHGMEVDRGDLLDYAVNSNRAIVAFPEGIITYDCHGRMWNPWDDSNGTDDVDYLSRVIAWLTSQLRVDPARVFISGFSDGAGMTQRFAATRPDLIAGAAAFGHSSGYEYAVPGRSGTRFALPEAVRPGVPILIFRGGEDPRIPPLDTTVSEKGKLVDTPREQLNYWLGANQCEGNQFTTPPLPVGIDLEGDVRFERYAACAAGHEVWFFFDPNLGHRWPRKERDQFDGDRLVLEFFLRNSSSTGGPSSSTEEL